MNGFTVAGSRSLRCPGGRLLRPHSREAKDIAKHLAWCCRHNPDAVGMFCDAERYNDEFHGCPYFAEVYKTEGCSRFHCKEVSEGHWTRLVLAGWVRFFAHDKENDS